MNVKYAIIEDEIYARQSLERRIKRLRPDYEMIFSTDSVKESIEVLEEKGNPDLIFMDIELSDGICFEIFEGVNVDCPVIFTTAYDDYAIRAFKVNSIDYLLKPVGDAELSLALNKFERMSPLMQMPRDFKKIENEIYQNNNVAVRRMLLLSGDKFSWADLNEGCLIESEDDYVFVTLVDGKRSLSAQKSLSKTLANLPSELFFQIDRSTIVSIHAIKSVSKYFKGRLLVKVSCAEDSKSYIVSSSRRDDFLKWLGK